MENEKAKLPPGLKDDFYREMQDPFKKSIFEPTENPEDLRKEWLADRGLTPREIEVTMCVFSGMRNKEVANKLFITEKTVKFHLTNIFAKLKVISRHQMICKIHGVIL